MTSTSTMLPQVTADGNLMGLQDEVQKAKNQLARAQAALDEAVHAQPPAFEAYEALTSTPLFGEPSLPLWQDWLRTQPEDPELSRLAAAVAVAEQDFADVRLRLPSLSSLKRTAEDTGDGPLFATATALISGSPRLYGKLAGLRVAASLNWLARLHLLALRAVASAEGDLSRMTPELVALRKDMAGPQSGRRAVEHGQLSPLGPTEAVYRDLYAASRPAAQAIEEAKQIADYCGIRARFFSAVPDDRTLDLTLPTTFHAVISAAAARAQKNAEREVDSHGY